MSRRTKLSYSVARLQFSVMMCAIFYTMAMTTKDKTIADIGFGLYFACLSFAEYMILRLIYTMVVAGNPNATGKRWVWYTIVAGLDSFFVSFNFVNKTYFEIKSITLSSGSEILIPEFSALFVFHLMIMGIMAVAVLAHTIIEIFKSSRINKGKYITILSFSSAIFGLGLLYILFPDFIHIDYSLAVFQMLAVSAFIFTLSLLPAGIRKSMLSVANRDITDAVMCFDFDKNCIYKNRLAQKCFPEKTKNIQWIQTLLNSDEELRQFRKEIYLEDSIHTFDIEYRQILDRRKKATAYYLKLNDITLELKKLQEEQYRSTHDELTGLYNRNYFFSEMERILLENTDIDFYIICTNIKNFKLINDLFGVKFGDRLLKQQATEMLKSNSENRILGRISADRFAMLIPKEHFLPEMAMKNTTHLQELSKNMNFKFNIYIGVYDITNRYENVHTMYDKAFLAIKNNKQDGQTISYYNTTLMRKIMADKNIISEFKYALNTDQFKMYLQPQIMCSTGKCFGAEALVRWVDLDNKYRQPGEFIPVLEEAGLIYKLDYYIWEKAVQKVSEWKSKGYKDYYISVNISVKDFFFADLYTVFTELVEKYDVPASSIHLEITESVIMSDDNFHREVLSHLREYGFRVEMDDFGSGYSSLSTLKKMTMDVLKIDMGFISKTNNEERGKVIVSSIIKMAKALGMNVISEGVENEEQAQFLKETGSDVFQGYLFSKPIRVDEFEEKYMEVHE